MPPTINVIKDLAPTGVLRVAINLGNPVLAQGAAAAPTGITVDIAREVGRRLGLPVELQSFDAALQSFEATRAGQVDLCFLAIEPVRAAEIAFTAAYLTIEGVYAVPAISSLHTIDEVDRQGVRVGVNLGSAYDLYLSRTLQQACLIRGEDGLEEFRAQCLEAVAGIRYPLAKYVERHPDMRLIDQPFMEIRQAVGTSTSRNGETVRLLHSLVEELKAEGFVADSLSRAGLVGAASVAPPATFESAVGTNTWRIQQ